MLREKILLLSVLLVGLVFLSACGPKDTPPPEVPEVTEVAQVELEATATDVPTEIPEPTPTLKPMVAPTDEPTEEIIEENEAAACVDCHSDKDLLIETARVEEEVASENEGEG